jgi:hypothetical protein
LSLAVKLGYCNSGGTMQSSSSGAGVWSFITIGREEFLVFKKYKEAEFKSTCISATVPEALLH